MPNCVVEFPACPEWSFASTFRCVFDGAPTSRSLVQCFAASRVGAYSCGAYLNPARQEHIARPLRKALLTARPSESPRTLYEQTTVDTAHADQVLLRRWCGVSSSPTAGRIAGAAGGGQPVAGHANEGSTSHGQAGLPQAPTMPADDVSNRRATSSARRLAMPPSSRIIAGAR